MSADAPADLLACHPETAYFWGHVAGGGGVEADRLTVQAPDEACAERLVAVAGGGAVDHRGPSGRTPTTPRSPGPKTSTTSP